MLGIKVISNKMNIFRLFFYFSILLIIPIIIKSYKNNDIDDSDNDENSQSQNLVKKNSFKSNQQIIETENNMNQKLYSKSTTEIVDISKEKKIINFGEGNKDILFVSTLDGNIHAIDSNNNELWKISLGKSLINSHLNNYNILEQNSIIPDLDGNIYLYSMHNDNKLTKIDVPIKTLIDSSPFTLPNIPNTIFLGDKKSSIFTIDIEKGIIVSKISNSGSVGYINQKPIQTNNLLTVIRTDYTLSSFNQVMGSQSWNVTVSEIMAIQKGSKNEIAVNWKRENSNNLMGKISKLLENPNLNSIVSIHNYISDSNLPVKIYDNKIAFNSDITEFDFETFLNSNKDKFFKNYGNNIIDEINKKDNKNDQDSGISLNNRNSLVNIIDKYPKSPYNYYFDENISDKNIKINFDQIFKDYLNYTKTKLKENSKIFKHNGTLGKIFYKFWELYYFDDYFYLYMSVFMILVGIIIFLIVIIVKIYKKNNRLKDKLKLRKKSSESIEETNKNTGNNKDNENMNSNEQNINEIKNNMTCFNTESGPICIYTENKNIKNLQKLINEKINSDNFNNIKDKDLIQIEDITEENKNNFNNDPLKFQSIRIHNDAKLNLLNNNKQFEELFKPQLDLNLKDAEIQNKVESTFCFLKDSDGKIVKIENKQLITKYDDNPEVEERIMQITGQIGLINFSENKNVKVDIVNKNDLKKDNYENDKSYDLNEKKNEGIICEYKNLNIDNAFKLYNKYNDSININNKFVERKFSENIDFTKTNSNNFDIEFNENNLTNSEEFSRAKSNDNKKTDFQPIQFSIKALKEKEKTEFTFEKGTVSSLGLYNASTNTDYLKNETNSEIYSSNINSQIEKENKEKININKIENSLVLVKDFNKNNNGEFAKNMNKNYLNVNGNYNLQISVKDRSKSRQRKESNITNSGNKKEDKKNINEKKFQKSPNDKKSNVNNYLEINSNEKKIHKKNEIASSISKTNNLNLKCKYKEYKEFNIINENEKNKLLKIDTTFIDEGRIGKNFEEFSKVGEGGFGSVFKAKHKIDGSLYAIKVIKLNVGISQSLKDHKVIKEVKTMMKLYHKNVVRYYTCWFQLNIDEIKNLKSESDAENQSRLTSSAALSNSNLFTNTIIKKKNYDDKNKERSESLFGSVSNFQRSTLQKEKRDKVRNYYEESSEISKTKTNIIINNNKNNKIIRKINFNNVRDKSNYYGNHKYFESPDKSRNNSSSYDECNFIYNSKSNYISKSVNKNSSLINYYSATANKNYKKSANQFIEINNTKSGILNQISENGESDFNSKNQSGAGGFNWNDSNFISKRNNEESYIKSQNENSKRRGRSSENSKINISYNGNSFWNESKSKKDYIENSIKHVKFIDVENFNKDRENINHNNDFNSINYNKNNSKENYKNVSLTQENIDMQIRKFSSLTDEMNPDNNLIDKKAFSISLEKDAEEILSDISNENKIEDSYMSNDESKNTNKLNNNNYKNGNIKDQNINKINKKQPAQDDSIIDLTKRNKKKKKEFVYNVYFLVQMEFCDGLSLNQYLEINKIKGLNRQTIFSFFKQILSGVNQIHKSNIIHRDLKPHNIFVIGENSLKIGDFGLAYDLENYARQKKLNNSNNKNSNNINNNSSSNILANFDNSFIKIDEFVGTPLYQSPEQLKELAYNEKVDIYAMGLILYEMCACFKTGMERRLSIEKLRNEHKIENKIQTKYEIESDLILLMTRQKPSDRPSAQEILNSDKFKSWKKQFSD